MQLSPATSETPPVSVLGHMTLNVKMLAVSSTVNQVGKKEFKMISAPMFQHIMAKIKLPKTPHSMVVI